MSLAAILNTVSAAGTGGNLGTMFVRLTADSTNMVRGLSQAETSIARTAAVWAKAAAGLSITAATAFAAVAAAGVKAAADFESSFAGVRKTVDATESEFALLKQSFRDMAKEIPVNVNAINKVAEMAGQLGIENDKLVSFTRTMVDLGNTTNLSSEEGAAQLARFANITQMSQKDFDRLGSTIVGLGNNFATTEAEIVSMAMRLGGAGSVVGLTQAQIVSMATALSSVGIEAEAGGTAMSQAMIKMAKAVAQGGADLDAFARASGMSASQFAEAFKKDATGAILAFFAGLKKITEQGGDVFTMLETMQLDGIRLTDVMLRMSGSGDLFTRALKVGNDAWRENTALAEEARKRYETFYSQITITWNRIKDMAITIGDALLPILKILNASLQTVLGSNGEFGRSFEKFVSIIAPSVLYTVGKIGDAIEGWRILIKTGEIAFLGWASVVSGVYAKVGAGIAAVMETVVNGVIEGVNKSIDAINILLPRAQEFQKIAFHLNIDTSSLERQNEIWVGSTKEAYDELAALTSKGTFSQRLAAEYSKVTAKVQEENKKVVENTKATMAAVAAAKAPEYNDKELMKGLDMPGESNTLRSLQDHESQRLVESQLEMDAAKDRLATLQELGQMELDATGKLSEEKIKLLESYNERVRQLQLAQAQLVLSTNSRMFGDLASIAETFAGKQSGLYRGMFMASKAFAIAEATVAIYQGIAKAAAEKFPLNLAAMASVVSATAGIVSNIKSVQMEFAGERALGGAVSGGKAYLVGERGPELFSPASNGNIVPNEELGARVKVVVNNFTDAQPEVQERNEGNERVIEVIIRRVKNEIGSEIRDGRGDVNRAMESTFGLRRGR